LDVLLKRTVTADDVGLDGDVTVGWADGVTSTVHVRLASLLAGRRALGADPEGVAAFGGFR
jgi:hypothetical protein